jgi:putative transposase
MAVHVIQRGNNRAACFRTSSDYLFYLLHLRELAKKHECDAHAYCLMPNHVHLLMTPPSAAACGALMRELGQRYVQYFNRRYQRTGSLWEGRFRSCITDTAEYVLACYRYIELNPVRAGIVQRPAEYEWSSHGANAGRNSDSLLVPHIEYLALGSDAEVRTRNYVGMFEQPLEPSMVGVIRKATNAGYPLWGQSPGSVPGS